jgi:hypothetical protein
MGRKHEVQIHPIPIRYKTDTDKHKAGEVVNYKYKYIVLCLHTDCYATLVGGADWTFSSATKAKAWKEAHLAENETFGQRVLRRLDGLWGELKR